MSNQNNEDRNKSILLLNIINTMKTTTKTEDIVVIGAGIAGLIAAIYLAREGHTVTVFEQSSTVGGRARTLYRMDFI